MNGDGITSDRLINRKPDKASTALMSRLTGNLIGIRAGLITI
jgi:hypothetical protein